MAMKYLTETRGLTRQTLRKYGVGLGAYNFRRNDAVVTAGGGGNGSMTNHHLQFVRADCITFPWIMRASEVHEQEVLRGSVFDQGQLQQWSSERKESNKVDRKKEEQDGGNHDDKEEEKEEEEENQEDRFVLRRIKARALEQKSWQRLDPPGGGWGLFGWHTVPEDAKEIVLTEGEYDAMAVYQATGRPAVSLPNGCRSLPVEVLPMLERFETIYLWMDSDVPGREGAEQFAKKIGVNRCLLVQPEPSVDGLSPPKDANEALLRGMDLDEMIMKASVLPHERILTFRELRGQVLHEMLNPNEYAGVPVPSLPKFTEIIKGFRRGELTVLTGPTGSGKQVASI
jgi:DNA primase (bacterial type)